MMRKILKNSILESLLRYLLIYCQKVRYVLLPISLLENTILFSLKVTFALVCRTVFTPDINMNRIKVSRINKYQVVSRQDKVDTQRKLVPFCRV